MAKTFTIVNDLSANIASGFGIQKAHVKSYTKTTKDGNQVQVKEHEDKRQHKVAVTVSDPSHTMVTKRKEKTQRFVKVNASSNEEAIERAKAHYKKAGYKVHDAEHHSVEESKNERKVEFSSEKQNRLNELSKITSPTESELNERIKLRKEKLTAKYLNHSLHQQDKEKKEPMKQRIFAKQDAEKLTEQKARIKKVSDMLFQRTHYSSRVSNSEMIKLRAEFKELKASIEKQDPDAMKTFNRFGNFEGR